MDGFIQRSSDPSQPGRAMDKKNKTKTLKTKFISASFKMFLGKKWKSKRLTGISTLTPPIMKIKVFSFLDELDYFDHL